MKAKAKLEKMIRKAGVEERAKELSMKIESTFEETANTKGELYRTVAYERMRNIKTQLAEFSERKVNCSEIKHYLEKLLQTYSTNNSVFHVAHERH
jgi:hypothetical protein